VTPAPQHGNALRVSEVTSNLRSISYDFLHVLEYEMGLAENTNLDMGTTIVSVDIDVGHEEVGLRNQGRNDLNVSSFMSERQIGRIEQDALPILLDCLDSYDMPATLAFRGQLFDVSPQSAEMVLDRSKYDIGGHGYYHKNFIDLTRLEAEHELEMLQEGMKKFNLVPRSFVFPRNGIHHLDVLRAFGYSCFRSEGGFPNNKMLIEMVAGLCSIHPTFYIDQRTSLFALKRLTDVAARKTCPAHFWFHLWSLGYNVSTIQGTIDRVFHPWLAYVDKLRDQGTITVKTMREVAESRKTQE